MNKLELQAEYKEQFGEAPDGSLTKAELKSAMNTNNSANEALEEIEECYWDNPVHCNKFGLMTGRVTKEQAAWYDSVTPDGVSYKDATLSYDPIEKRKKEARKKFENRER